MPLIESNQLRLVETLREQAAFTDREMASFLTFLEMRRVKKKEHILRAGEISGATAYVKTGCLRRYVIDEHGKDVILYLQRLRPLGASRRLYPN